MGQKNQHFEIPLYEDINEFEDEAKELILNHSANKGGGEALTSDEDRDNYEMIEIISIGIEVIHMIKM